MAPTDEVRTTVDVAGVPFTVRPRPGSGDAEFWALFAAERFEPETLAVLRAALGPGRALLDIGAWIGPMTLYAASLGSTVTALEADPVAVAALEANLAANPGPAGRVTVVAAALAGRAGHVAIDGGSAGLGRGVSRVTATAPTATAPATVEALDVAGLDARAPLERFAVIKLDIEGGEYAVAPALGRHLSRLARRPVLLLSLHGADPATLRRTARPLARLRQAPARLRLLWSFRAYRSVRRIASHRARGTVPLGLRALLVLAFRLGETELVYSDAPLGPAGST